MFEPSLRRSTLAAAVAAALPGVAIAQTAARVDFAVGGATATGSDGRVRPLQKGSDILVGDLIDTGKGRVQLRFLDGAQMALQPDTNFKVEEFRFAQKGEGNDGVVMNLIKGGMRTITGIIGRSNRAAYSLKTPSATIGIRGTEFTAEMRDTLRAFCVQGLIFLGNGGGGLLLSSGQGAFVRSFTAPPQRNDTKPSLPTISSKEMEVLLKVANVDPKNPTQDFNPVVTLQTVLAQLSNSTFAGTLNGNWAVSLDAPVSGPGAVTNQKIVMNSGGALVQFDDASAGFTTPVGTATASSGGNDGIVAWGKWTGGTTGGVNPAYSGRDLNATGPLHYVVGLPVSSLPTTGSAYYTLLGHTASCAGGGCTYARVNDSHLMVDFASSYVSLGMSLTIDGTVGGNYSVYGSAGGLNNGRFGMPAVAYGPNSQSSATVNAAGFLSGSGALRAGLAWNGVLGGITSVTGANAYTQSTYPAAPVVTTPPPLTGTQTANWSTSYYQSNGISFASQSSAQSTVVLNPSGVLSQFSDATNTYSATTGTATGVSQGNDGTIAWGSWANGTTGGTYPTISNQVLSSTGPLHYVVGLPATAIPTTGTATYAMLGSTASCSGSSGCTSATVNNSTLSVDFGASTVGLAMSVTVNGLGAGTFTYSGSPVQLSAGNFNVCGSMLGGAGGGLSGKGFLSGTGATRAGLSWSGETTASSYTTYIRGATAYSR